MSRGGRPTAEASGMWIDDCRCFCEEEARRFLAEREFGCVRASENLHLWLSSPEWREFFSVYMHLPEGATGGSIDGLAVTDSDGALYALLPDSSLDDQELASMLGHRDDVHRVSGPAQNVRRIVSALGEGMWQHRSYLLMRARSVDIAFPPDDVRIEVRDAYREDFDALLLLQMAYEREELNLMSTRSETVTRIQSLLERQLVAIAFYGDEPIAKINTNARGYFYDQIGGFYVRPAYRSRGIGRGVLFYLLRRIKACRRDPVLFVRPENIPAIRVYRRAGFRTVDEYTVSARDMRGQA